jgi:acetate kinase
MKVLVVNCGSSSVKYTLFEMSSEKKLAWGLVECIGLQEASYISQTVGTEVKKSFVKITTHTEAVEFIIENLLDGETGSIKNVNEIAVVGHRIVHGGNKFSKSVLVTKNVKKSLVECFSMAPLHNPANYAGILAVEKMFPNSTPSVLVFDTAFHQTIPDYAYMYAIPYEFYERDNIRKYGFHGTSHSYVSKRAAIMLRIPMSELKLITVHLGNGSSVAAVKNGEVVDTSMGFTPLQGVVMGTRCGDIDPAVLIYILDKYPQYKSDDALNVLMNEQSGLCGISGVSSDMRAILEASAKGNKRSKLAYEMFCYSVKKYISAYYGILNGADGLVFTAGVGENSAFIRKEVCMNLSALGIEIDIEKNMDCFTGERFISKKKSEVKVMVIPTNEELMIAKESKKVLTASAV